MVILGSGKVLISVCLEEVFVYLVFNIKVKCNVYRFIALVSWRGIGEVYKKD